MYRPVAYLNKTAHESQTFEDVLHCPFDGSGQLIGGSDGNINCSFCGKSFMVRIQPQYSAMPQTGPDGQPMTPGPTEAIDPDAAADASGAPPVDPNEAPDAPGGQTNPAPDGAPDPTEAPVPPAKPDPFAKGSMLVTDEGYALPYGDYLRRLAITHASDRSAVLRQVRASYGPSEGD